MWLLMLFFFQDPAVMDPEPVNAKLFLESGKQIELVDIKIRGIEPYTFEFSAKGSSTFISLFRVARIKRVEDTKDFEILLDDGVPRVGRIKAFILVGTRVDDPSRIEQFNVFDIERVHFILGSQLRSCLKGHYEHYTPHAFCPVCGDELVIGPYPDEFPEKNTRYKYHLLRLDPRKQ